ncbi:MAG: LysM peptidoglycan-binding domain-containing protein [Bacilli bacterium]|nr:LysM peptidoglycan-binding domain-containing protein [Bacilli bacterium]
MNCIIPFESKVKFPGTVKEICSISLEHEITKNDSEILGNFIVSGTYKEHELSVNTSDFKFTIPFNVELTTRIENDSLEFSIDNFTYDMDESEMVVKIDYIVTADDVREEIIEEEVIEEDPLDLIEDTNPIVVISDPEDRIIEAPVEVIQEVISNPEIIEDDRDEITEVIAPEMVSALETENDYMTYHIHVVKENETIETIALQYKVTKDDIEKINDVSNLAKDMKLIIPIINE